MYAGHKANLWYVCLVTSTVTAASVQRLAQQKRLHNVIKVMTLAACSVAYMY